MIIGLIIAFFVCDLQRYTDLAYIQSRLGDLQAEVKEHFILAASVYFIVYIVSTMASLPLALPLTLLGGALFGVVAGVIIVSFASTIGATLAMLSARYVFRDWIEAKFGERLQLINNGIEKEGAMYLFSLRLIPIFPFFAVNYLMGLTRLPAKTYYWVSQLGMLPGTVAFVYLGTGLASLTSLSGLFSGRLLLAFAGIGLLPWIAKFIVAKLKSRQSVQASALKGQIKPDAFDYNVIVIGAGAAGLVSSLVGSTVGAKVLLIEKHQMGGDCLNTGCVPSKALLRVAKAAHEAQKANQWGIDTRVGVIDFDAVKAHVQKAIATIEPNDSIERYQSLGVDVIQGDARLVSPWQVEVNGTIHAGRKIILATGARPFMPPIKGLDTIDYLTSDTIWSLDKLPKTLAVIGGGAIGCELSQAFARLGVDVTIIEAAPHIMARSDARVAEVLSEALHADGINIIANHRLTEVSQSATDEVILHIEHDNIRQKITAEKVLIAIGRAPNVGGIGLEDVGVELTERKAIAVNEQLQTTVSSIYACGDCIGGIQLTHVSGHEAWYASVNALFGAFKSFKANYRVIPAAVFTDPEVASVGISEREAVEQGIAHEVTCFEMAEVDRAIADDAKAGFIQIITPPNKDKILGVTIVGAHASDTIAEFALAMNNKLGLKKIMGTVHLYPSYQDGAKLAAGAWQKKHKPEKLLNFLNKYFAKQVK